MYVTILVQEKSSLSEGMTETCSVVMQLQPVSPAEEKWLLKYNHLLLENQSYSKCNINRQKVSERNVKSKTTTSKCVVGAVNACVCCD